MNTTDTFKKVISLLAAGIGRDGSFALSADAAGDISKGLKTIVQKLPGGELALTKASGKEGDTEDKWSLNGTPSMPELRVPGFPELSFDLPKAKMVLKVKDGGQEKGKDKEPKFELGISASQPVMSATIPVKLTITEKDEQLLVFGDSEKAPLEADLVALAEKCDWSDATEELLNVAELVKLRKARLIQAAFKVEVKKERKPSISSFSMEAGLTFGKVDIRLAIAANRSSSGQFDREAFEVKGTAGRESGGFRLGEILNDAVGTSILPRELDPNLQSLSFARECVSPKKRLNERDKQRIVFRSPADSKTPEVLITSAFDEMGPKFLAARIGWPALDVVSLTMIGDQMQLSFEPLLVVMTNKTLKMGWATSLFDLAAFPGLETMGTPEDKAEEMEIRKGFHCTGIFKMGDLLEVAYHFPVRVSKDPLDDLPFDAANLDEPEAATPVPVERKVRALKLHGVAFKYESSAVSLIVDAVLETRGLTIAPLGLRASYALQKPEDKSSRISFGMDGGLLAFKSGELSIAGGFVRDTSIPGANDWLGVGLLKYGKNFSLAAVFAFRDGEDKSLFVFAYVRRQLGGPAWCYVTGLAAGFGYNRAFTMPAVDKVNKFALISIASKLSQGDKDAVPEKMNGKALKEMVDGLKGVKPESGANFGTVGVTFSTFGFMNSTVLLTVMFGTRLEFSLLGSSTIDIPAKSPAAHADVQLVGAVKPDDGLFALDAVLGPNSYVLSKACRLTGGFSLRTWFSGEHAKDFVISLGGYHPSYQKPDHYPAVPRLGFLWKVSPVMRIAGFAYLAVTPKSVQLGGGLDMVYELDPLRAWLHVEAHFLIAWKPTYYDIALKVELGVSFRMDLLFCSVTLSLDISADIHLWGPDFSGRADVHLWFATFSFNFGADPKEKEPKPLWGEFVSSFITPVPPEPKPKRSPVQARLAEPAPLPLDVVPLSGTSAAPAGLKISGGDFDGKQVDWLADPQNIELKVATAIPAETAGFNATELARAEKIYAHPLEGLPHIEPELRVTLTRADRKNAAAPASRPFEVEAEAHVSAVPAALWGGIVKPGTELSGRDENVRGVTHVSLTPKTFEPHESLPVDTDVLLSSRIATEDRTWHKVQIPTRRFAWETYNPYATIASQPVANARNTMLDALQRLDFVPADSKETVDVRNVREGQPCFMARPILGSLGTANTNA